MNIMVQIISEFACNILHACFNVISTLLCIIAVGLSLMTEQLQHLLHLLWL